MDDDFDEEHVKKPLGLQFEDLLTALGVPSDRRNLLHSKLHDFQKQQYLNFCTSIVGNNPNFTDADEAMISSMDTDHSVDNIKVLALKHRITNSTPKWRNSFRSCEGVSVLIENIDNCLESKPFTDSNADALYALIKCIHFLLETEGLPALLETRGSIHAIAMSLDFNYPDLAILVLTVLNVICCAGVIGDCESRVWEVTVAMNHASQAKRERVPFTALVNALHSEYINLRVAALTFINSWKKWSVMEEKIKIRAALMQAGLDEQMKHPVNTSQRVAAEGRRQRCPDRRRKLEAKVIDGQCVFAVDLSRCVLSPGVLASPFGLVASSNRHGWAYLTADSLQLWMTSPNETTRPQTPGIELALSCVKSLDSFTTHPVMHDLYAQQLRINLSDGSSVSLGFGSGREEVFESWLQSLQLSVCAVKDSLAVYCNVESLTTGTNKIWQLQQQIYKDSKAYDLEQGLAVIKPTPSHLVNYLSMQLQSLPEGRRPAFSKKICCSLTELVNDLSSEVKIKTPVVYEGEGTATLPKSIDECHHMIEALKDQLKMQSKRPRGRRPRRQASNTRSIQNGPIQTVPVAASAAKSDLIPPPRNANGHGADSVATAAANTAAVATTAANTPAVATTAANTPTVAATNSGATTIVKGANYISATTVTSRGTHTVTLLGTGTNPSLKDSSRGQGIAPDSKHAPAPPAAPTAPASAAPSKVAVPAPRAPGPRASAAPAAPSNVAPRATPAAPGPPAPPAAPASAAPSKVAVPAPRAPGPRAPAAPSYVAPPAPRAGPTPAAPATASVPPPAPHATAPPPPPPPLPPPRPRPPPPLSSPPSAVSSSATESLSASQSVETSQQGPRVLLSRRTWPAIKPNRKRKSVAVEQLSSSVVLQSVWTKIEEVDLNYENIEKFFEWESSSSSSSSQDQAATGEDDTSPAVVMAATTAAPTSTAKATASESRAAPSAAISKLAAQAGLQTLLMKKALQPPTVAAASELAGAQSTAHVAASTAKASLKPDSGHRGSISVASLTAGIVGLKAAGAAAAAEVAVVTAVAAPPRVVNYTTEQVNISEKIERLKHRLEQSASMHETVKIGLAEFKKAEPDLLKYLGVALSVVNFLNSAIGNAPAQALIFADLIKFATTKANRKKYSVLHAIDEQVASIGYSPFFMTWPDTIDIFSCSNLVYSPRGDLKYCLDCGEEIAASLQAWQTDPTSPKEALSDLTQQWSPVAEQLRAWKELKLDIYAVDDCLLQLHKDYCVELPKFLADGSVSGGNMQVSGLVQSFFKPFAMFVAACQQVHSQNDSVSKSHKRSIVMKAAPVANHVVLSANVSNMPFSMTMGLVNSQTLKEKKFQEMREYLSGGESDDDEDSNFSDSE